MIKSNMEQLTVRKESADGKRWPYRAIAEATGLSKNVIQRLTTGDFDRLDLNSLNAICKFFGCKVGDVLEYVSDEEKGEE